MAKHARTDKASDRPATLGCLPRDTLGNIVRNVSFQDKSTLQLVSRDFHDLLRKPVSTEGLWGTCDLMPDLRLEDHFDSRENIMR